MEDNVRKLVSASNIDSKPFNLKKRLTSAFRRIIGNGQANHIVVTANHRAWRHMIELRTDPSAEEEIRVVFADISRQLRERFPTIYADAQVSVVDGIEVTKFEHSKV
jgi:thymidylate synthase (FAD)